MNDAPQNKRNLKSQIPGIIIGLGAIALTLYFAITDSGPVEMLNRFQINLMDAYYPKLTFMLTFLICLLPPVLVKLLIDKLRKKSS